LSQSWPISWSTSDARAHLLVSIILVLSLDLVHRHSSHPAFKAHILWRTNDNSSNFCHQALLEFWHRAILTMLIPHIRTNGDASNSSPSPVKSSILQELSSPVQHTMLHSNTRILTYFGLHLKHTSVGRHQIQNIIIPTSIQFLLNKAC